MSWLMDRQLPFKRLLVMALILACIFLQFSVNPKWPGGGGGAIRDNMSDFVAVGVATTTTTKSNKNEKKWATSTILPDWMKDYFEWHHQQRLLLNESSWASYQYLVISCLAEWDFCGGTSDRLQLIPYAIRVAAAVSANTTRRILFIKWERPAPLNAYTSYPSQS